MEVEKLQPIEVLKALDQMRRDDMERYLDPSSGKIRTSISEDVPACPACGVKRKRFLFQKEAFSYHQCSSCALVYVSPRLNDDNLTYLYREGRSGYQTRHFYLPTAAYRKETIYLRKVKQLLEASPGRKILDYGCSTGYFLQTAIENGFDGYGIELNPFGIQWAREELGLEHVFDRDISECGFEHGFFHVITMWDVLEHVPEPIGLLKALHPYLHRDGLMVIETSHYDCFETEVLGKENTNLVGDIHLMHFTIPSLDSLACRAGYTIAERDIFGLDLDHIIHYHHLNGLPEISMPTPLVKALQGLIDRVDKGCYVRAILKKES
jgi:2-polyprenyl-3-methyl-5-hydroxy-6-metoxy-1,4-benzoquinol methylase